MNLDQIDVIYGILCDALYSYELYKRLVLFFRKSDAIYDPFEKELWRNISDNSIQMAAIQWNKIFGSIVPNRNNENTHYTQLLSAEEFDFYLMMKGIDFADTIDKMREFRDKFAAHKDRKEFAVPYFYRAIKIIHEFDLLVREKYIELKQRYYQTLFVKHESFRIRIEDYLVGKDILSGNDIGNTELSNDFYIPEKGI